MNSIKLLVAEDHNIVRQGLCEMLNDFNDIAVIAEAENGLSMVDKYFEFNPDIVISDIEMPRLPGTEAAQQILYKDKKAKIIFLTMHNSDEYIYIAIKIGACGLIPKSVIKNELIRAIKIVAKGEKYFMNKSDAELEQIVKKYDLRVSEKPELRSVNLTPRDKEILLYIADGIKSEQIADKLNLSKRTIDMERSKLMAKLKLDTAQQLVKYAIEYSMSMQDKLK